jgi:serine/threonine-protein kinase HipA
MTSQCLYCYQPLLEGEKDFHLKCSRKFFSQEDPPELPFEEDDIERMAEQVVRSQIAVTGVQPKLSLDLVGNGRGSGTKKFTMVGLWGSFILKPPSSHYPSLPETEDLTMHLAEAAGIRTVPHSLMRFQSGSLAYLSRRIDRNQAEKLHMEDMCQLTDRMTEEKYNGSHEQIAKAILKYSAQPGLDVVNYYEVVLFSFLTGNADMHLKNFSLISRQGIGPVLAPAYDLVSTALVNPKDQEELALTLNARKKKITRRDFITAFNSSYLEPRQQENIFNKMEAVKSTWNEWIHNSFLTEEYREDLIRIINQRFSAVY